MDSPQIPRLAWIIIAIAWILAGVFNILDVIFTMFYIKRFFLFMAFDGFLSCSHQTSDTSSVIYEGKGVDNVIIGKANRNFLKQNFSTVYDSSLHGSYSTDIHYPQKGTHYYYLQSDNSATIFAMGFDSMFKGRTSKGFDIHRMLVHDMSLIYGKPRWQMLKSAHMLYAHYDSQGIYFAIIPNNKREPDFYLNVKEHDNASDSIAEYKQQHYYDSIYSRSRIAEIIIGRTGTNY